MIEWEVIKPAAFQIGPCRVVEISVHNGGISDIVMEADDGERFKLYPAQYGNEITVARIKRKRVWRVEAAFSDDGPTMETVLASEDEADDFKRRLEEKHGGEVTVTITEEQH